MTVRILPQAEADIIHQFRFYLVDRDAPLIALRFRQSVMETANRVATSPKAGTPVETSLAGLRSWPVQGFEEIRLYYRETPNCVDVVRVLHGKRSLRRILKGYQG